MTCSRRLGIPRISWIFILLFVVSAALFFPTDAAAVNQIETKYFTIIYDRNGEFTAGEIAKFCDDVYERLMSLYDAFTDNPRVVCIVNDAVDMANGYAVYYQNIITIYATNMDYELRGQSNWLKNVFVHEMTHMVALKKAAKGPINFIGISGGRYNRNPDISAFVAFYHLSQPAWFSEGTAQMGTESFGADSWDTHRDMVLRTAWYEDRLLSYDEMSVLSGQTGMDAEMVYNQGYSLVNYIKEKYGYEKVVEMNNRCGFFDFDPTVRDVLGISPRRLYSDWRKSLDVRYAAFKNRKFDEGEPVADEGSVDYYPAVSPDGRYLAWLSNRGRDYAITDLMLMDLTTGETRVLVEEVDKRVAWSHDSRKLVYVKRPPRRPNFYDIYIYDIETGRERRVSRRMRASDPAFSPGDSLIVFVRNHGGNNSLGIIDADGTNLRYLTSTHDGTQFYKPSFSPDGSRIIFGLYRQDLDRDIAIINAESGTYRYKWEIADSASCFTDSTSFAADSRFELLVATGSDERDPCFLPDGSGIVYVSDRNGVFNVYRLDFATGKHTRLTDLYGGAFCPSAGGSGEVYYAGYSAGRFSIYRTALDREIEKTELAFEKRDYFNQPPPFKLKEYFQVSPFTGRRVVNAILPVVYVGPSFIGSRFGLRVLNVGVETYISDILGRDAFVFSGSVGKNLKANTPLNSSFGVYYQKKMVPLTSSRYTHSPTLYMSASRWVINNLIDRYKGFADSVYFADMPSYGLKNVLHDLYQELDIADSYRHEFRVYSVGVQVPLAPHHRLNFGFGFRQYTETLRRNQELHDHSQFFVNGEDVTSKIDGAGSSRVTETRYFTDLEYFRGGECSMDYQYMDIEPEADTDISPVGVSAFVRFKHMKTVHADSLVGQAALQIPIGMYSSGAFAIVEYIPDRFMDKLRPLKKNLDVNEYILFLQRNQRMPFFRHVLAGTALVGYRDVSLKDAWKGEGSGYNWPLKYYLGGQSLLCGYPYFSFWGTKLFYSRLDYVFPIRRKIGKNVLGVHFQRLYGAVFFEAAKVWNFSSLSMDRLREGSFKRDVGFEARLKMISFYRLPVFMTAKVAWPLDDMKDSPYRDQRDARRFYFGLQM